jgi:Na+-driven multidrug efflux pump
LRNLTVGPPTRLILLFSLPLLLGNLFQQFYIFVDSAVVGRIIGQDGLAAVGLTGRMVFLIIGFSWGATAGFAIPVAKAFGAKDYVQVKRNIASSAIVACFVIVAITAAGLYFGDSLLRLINTPVELFTMASEYQAIMFGTAVFTVGFNWLAATIRALGDSKTPLYFLIASNILNAVFSYIAVGPMGMGVAGSAWVPPLLSSLPSSLVCGTPSAKCRKCSPLFPISKRAFTSFPSRQDLVCPWVSKCQLSV